MQGVPWRLSLTGKNVANLTLKDFRVDERGHTHWKCECVCGKIVERRQDYLLRAAPSASCGCKHPRRNKGELHPTYKGIGDLNGHYYGTLERNAMTRNLEFEVSIEYLWELFLRQDKVCALTKIPLCFQSQKDKIAGADQTASLDRIDPVLGYVEGNVQWVHKDVNWMKNNYSQERFLEICRLVTQYAAAA